MKVKSLSCVQLFVTPWTADHQAPRSMGFCRQEYWSGLPFPSPPGKHALRQGQKKKKREQKAKVPEGKKICHALRERDSASPDSLVLILVQMVKNLPAMQIWVQSLGWEDPPGERNGNPTQYSCLENSMDRGAWRATVHVVTKSRT